MRNLNTVIKDGTVDYIFGECELKRRIIDSLLSLYKKWGYAEIMTPIIEYLDVFCGREVGEMIKPEDIYTFTDEKNRRIAIRPDCTMPIARIASSKLKNEALPFRLCYSQSTVRAHETPIESTQSGVELIGASGTAPDTEIVMLGARSLGCFDPSYRIELGHGMLLSALTAEYGVSAELSERAKEHIERKNFAALEAMELPDAIKKLPRYFGDVSVLDDYGRIAGSKAVGEILDYLRQLYEKLSECGFGDSISFDLGIVNSLDYYTGIIFRGYMSDSGKTVLSGGRYDRLLEKYGAAFPAVGFGINTDRVFEAKKTGGVINSVPDIMIRFDGGCEAAAYREAEKLTSEGIPVMLSFAKDSAGATEEASARGIKKLLDFTAEGRREICL